MKNLYYILIISISISCFTGFAMENQSPEKNDYIVSTKYPQYNKIEKMFPWVSEAEKHKIRATPEYVSNLETATDIYKKVIEHEFFDDIRPTFDTLVYVQYEPNLRNSTNRLSSISYCADKTPRTTLKIDNQILNVLDAGNEKQYLYYLTTQALVDYNFLHNKIVKKDKLEKDIGNNMNDSRKKVKIEYQKFFGYSLASIACISLAFSTLLYQSTSPAKSIGIATIGCAIGGAAFIQNKEYNNHKNVHYKNLLNYKFFASDWKIESILGKQGCLRPCAYDTAEMNFSYQSLIKRFEQL